MIIMDGKGNEHELLPGVYQHYKTKGYYKLIGLGRHSETLENMILYQSVDTGEFWVRPARMWFDKVFDLDNGVNTTRFRWVSEM